MSNLLGLLLVLANPSLVAPGESVPRRTEPRWQALGSAE